MQQTLETVQARLNLGRLLEDILSRERDLVVVKLFVEELFVEELFIVEL